MTTSPLLLENRPFLSQVKNPPFSSRVVLFCLRSKNPPFSWQRTPWLHNVYPTSTKSPGLSSTPEHIALGFDFLLSPNMIGKSLHMHCRSRSIGLPSSCTLELWYSFVQRPILCRSFLIKWLWCLYPWVRSSIPRGPCLYHSFLTYPLSGPPVSLDWLSPLVSID